MRSAAGSLLPALIRRRLDQDRRVRLAAAGALAHLLPQLPDRARGWLALLTESGRTAADNLRLALERPDLPGEVRWELAAACGRRARWHAGQAGICLPAGGDEGTASVWDLASQAAQAAADKAIRHVPAGRKGPVAAAAREAEHAWQLAYLWTLLRADWELDSTP